MHELLVTASFIAMVIVPCIVCMNTGKNLDDEA